MRSERKQEILGCIGGWLDTWPDDEPLPEGLDPAVVERGDPPPDLAGLAAAVTACSREAQIQSKVFKRLSEDVAAVLHQRQDERHEAGVGPELEGLMELHDRLSRCVVEGRQRAGGLSWLARRSGAHSMLEGVLGAVALSLARAEDLLARAGVRPIQSDGRPFDASCMRALDSVAAGADRAPGTVAATLRCGYLRGDRVLRPAEVRVAR